MQSRSTPTRKKPHCRSCGLPMEGHRRSGCPGYNEEEKDGGYEDSSKEKGRDNPLKTPAPSPLKDLAFEKSKSTAKPSSSKVPLAVLGELESDSLVLVQELDSDQDRKPIVLTPSKMPLQSRKKKRDSKTSILSLPTKLILDSDEDNDDVDPTRLETSSPVPVATIYAASDVSPSAIQRACERSGGKYHTGVFYTVAAMSNFSSVSSSDSDKGNGKIKVKDSKKREGYAYKEWVIVGEDAELVRRVARGDNTSKPPGAFYRVGEEIVEGPRMVTVPQLVFASFIGAWLVWYALSVL